MHAKCMAEQHVSCHSCLVASSSEAAAGYDVFGSRRKPAAHANPIFLSPCIPMDRKGVSTLNPKPFDPRPLNPKPFDPRPLNPKPFDPRPLNPKPFDPRTLNPKPFDPRPLNPKPRTLIIKSPLSLLLACREASGVGLRNASVAPPSFVSSRMQWTKGRRTLHHGSMQHHQQGRREGRAGDTGTRLGTGLKPDLAHTFLYLSNKSLKSWAAKNS
jgi:hypothetical protein